VMRILPELSLLGQENDDACTAFVQELLAGRISI